MFESSEPKVGGRLYQVLTRKVFDGIVKLSKQATHTLANVYSLRMLRTGMCVYVCVSGVIISGLI